MSECPSCGEEKEHLGTHITQSASCEYTNMDQEKKEILIGLLMGDGCISDGRYTLAMVNKKFMNYINKKLEPWSCSLSKIRDARENVSMPHGGKSDTKPVYGFSIRSHPYIKKLESWFYSGKKKFPDGLSLTPKVTKMWYVSDGGLNWNNYHRANVQITSTNEINRRKYIESKIKDIGFDVNMSGKTIVFKKTETGDFLNWLGSPPPGFEYKWENENYFKYFELIDNHSKLSEEIQIIKYYDYHKHTLKDGIIKRGEKLDNNEVVKRTKDLFSKIDLGDFGSYSAKYILFGCLSTALEELGCMINFEPNYESIIEDMELEKEKARRVRKSVKRAYRNQ